MGAHVLVVEDYEPSRTFFQKLLERKGCRVTAVAHGLAALGVLDALAATPEALPDVILLDWMLPIMDGEEFLQQYRTRSDPHAPVVVMTGAGEWNQRAIEDAGVAAVLEKPIRTTALLAALHPYIGAPTEP